MRESTERALKEHSRSIQRALREPREHAEGIQRALSKMRRHQMLRNAEESIQRALREAKEHSERIQRAFRDHAERCTTRRYSQRKKILMWGSPVE